MHRVSAPQANPDDIDVLVIWGAIKRSFGKLMIFTVAIGVLVYLGLSFVKPQYASRAQIIIENDRTGLKQPGGSGARDRAPPLDKESIKSQVQVLKSGDLAQSVAKKLKLNTRIEFNSAVGASSLGSAVRIRVQSDPMRLWLKILRNSFE